MVLNKVAPSKIAPFSDARNCLVFDVDIFKHGKIAPAAQETVHSFCAVSNGHFSIRVSFLQRCSTDVSSLCFAGSNAGLLYK